MFSSKKLESTVEENIAWHFRVTMKFSRGAKVKMENLDMEIETATIGQN